MANRRHSSFVKTEVFSFSTLASLGVTYDIEKMRKRNVILTVVLALVTTPVLLGYLAFSNSIDCDQLVIDTYELHSNINIPKVEYVNCYFDKELNTRISVYDLRGSINLEDFEPLIVAVTQLRGIELLSKDELPPQSANLYLATGERWGTKWTYVIDRKSNRLWAELSY